MNISKFLARHRWLGLAILAVIAVSACVPIRQEASWPTLTPTNNGQDILLTYNDSIVKIDVTSGTPVKLRTLDGEIKLDAEGKAVIWQFTGPEHATNQFFSAPVQLNDKTMLVLTNANKKLYEINAERPDLPLTDANIFDLPGQVIANPLYAGDMIYVGAERNLLAINANDKTVRWEFPTDQSVWSQPLIVDGVLYFTSLDHRLYALDPDTGDELWRLDLEGAAPESPVFYNGRLYVGSFARKIFEISTDGKVVNTFPTDDWVWGQPVIVDGVLYAADVGGTVYAVALDGDNFAEKWHTRVNSEAKVAIRATPLVYDNNVVVGTKDNHIYWLTKEDGLLTTSKELKGEVLSDLLLIKPDASHDIPEPYVVASTLSNDQLLVAFKLSNGDEVWTYPKPS